MSLFLANCGLLARAPGGGGGIDPDADAYFTAAGITDAGMKTDANQFYLDAKADGYYNDFVAFYLYLGGDATKHSYNGKNPATHQITWNGTVTHNANGATGDGSTGYGNTGILGSSHLTNNSTHVAIYSRSNIAESRLDVGASDNLGSAILQLLLRNGADNLSSTAYDAGSQLIAPSSDSRGLFISTRTASNSFVVYRNGSNFTNGTASSGESVTSINNPIYLFCRNLAGSASNFSSKNHAFASVGAGLSSTKAADMYAAVQALQTARGRNV